MPSFVATIVKIPEAQQETASAARELAVWSCLLFSVLSSRGQVGPAVKVPHLGVVPAAIVFVAVEQQFD
jgi:hypothetical protein